MSHRICNTGSRRTFVWFLLLCLLLTCSGCKKEISDTQGYRDVKGGVFESQTVASNSEYELYWENDPGSILLKSKKNGKIWSDILYDSYRDGSESINGNSPISITVADIYSLKWETIPSYSEMEDTGYRLCKKIKNGIRITYFFPKYKIAVPIAYTLNEDGVSVSVDTSQILETVDDYMLVSVSLASFMCSAENNDKNYLFVPAGSGALMYTNEHAEGTRNYSGEVYGTDAARQEPEDFADDEPVRLPVFGAKNADTAMFGIITSGAGSAVIEAKAGNSKLGYSNVYPTFFVRGYDTFRFSSHGTGETIATRMTNNIHNQVATVRYYPLYDDKADYNGMAEKYREYLLDNKLLSKSTVAESPYSFSLYGGTTVTESAMGVPVDNLKSLTTFSQAYNIVKDAVAKNGIAPTTRLLYYGDKGILPGKVIGGASIPKIYGKGSELSRLKDFCSHNGSALYYDFDILQFAKSGNGFSNNYDTAKTAIKRSVMHYNLSPIRLQLEDSFYYMLAGDKLELALSKAIKKAKKYEIDNISFSSLGYVGYSDYSFEEYHLKSGITNFVKKAVREAQKNADLVATSAANAYSVCVDTIFDSSLENGNYHAFDEMIPFYQMVFHSYKTLYSKPINIADDPGLMIARAASCGIGLGYDLTATYVDASNDLITNKLYGTLYDGVSQDIQDVLIKKGFANLYKKVADVKLVQYQLLDKGLTKSVFENGTVIYVNHSANAVDSSIGEMEAYGFVVKEE